LGLLFSCEDIVSVPDISEDILMIIAPTDGAILQESTITFSWEEIEFAEEYQVQIATPSFEQANQVVLDTIISDSIQGIRNITTTLNPETYEWRVRALNSNFQTAYSTQSFALDTLQPVIDIANQVVTIVSPTEGAIINEGSINFNWEEVTGATSYDLQIATPNFETPIQIVTDTSLTELSFITTLENSEYAWRIRAKNESSETLYTTQGFEVVEEMTELSDQMVILISPDDGFETADTTISFSWELLEDATLYRIMIVDTSDDTVFTEVTTTTSDITIDLVSGSYQWSVRGESDTQNTAFTTRTITIL